MKIRSIFIRNLNSITGQNRIDLVYGKLANAGLFAIIGDTGAGKTTILDAITLAIFGKTAREKEGQILSTGATEGSAEVEFEASGGIYLAKWHQSRTKKDQKPGKAVRELAKLDFDKNEWHPISAGKRELDSTKDRIGLIEEICGLTFTQFCRSAMLAQGDFEAFLRANAADRSALLERLTDTAIYSELGKRAFDRAKSERAKLEELEKDRDRFEIFSPEKIAQLLDNQAIAHETVKNLSLQNDQLRRNIDWLEKGELLEKRAVELRQLQSTLAVKNTEATDKKIRLELHQLAAPFAADLALVSLKSTEIEENNAIIEQNQAQIVLLLPLENDYKAAENIAEKKFLELKIEQPARQKLFADVLVLDEKVDGQRQKLATAASEFQAVKNAVEAQILKISTTESDKKAAVEKHDFLQDWLRERAVWGEISAKIGGFERELRDLEQLTTDGKSQNEQLKYFQNQAAEFAQKVAREEQIFKETTDGFIQNQSIIEQIILENGFSASAESSLVQFNQKVENQSGRVAALETLAEAASAHWRSLETLGDSMETKQNLAAELDFLDKHLLSAMDETANRSAEMIEKKAKYEEIRAFSNYARDRKLLVSGHPCPLCGATEHPSAHHVLDDLEAVFAHQLAEATALFDQANSDFAKLAKRAEMGEFRLKNAELEWQKIAQAEADFLPKIAEILKKNKFPEAEIGSIGVLKNLIAEETQLLESQQVARNNFLKISEKTTAIRLLLAQQKSTIDGDINTRDNAQNEADKLDAMLKSFRHDFSQKSDFLKANLASFSVVFDRNIIQNNLAELREKQAEFDQKMQQNIDIGQQLKLIESDLVNLNRVLGQDLIKLQTRTEMERALKMELDTILSSRQILFGEKVVDYEQAQFSEALRSAEIQFSDARKLLINHTKSLHDFQFSVTTNKDLLLKNEAKKDEIVQKLNKRLEKFGQFDGLAAVQKAILLDIETEDLQFFLQTLAEENLRVEQSDADLKIATENHSKHSFSEQNKATAIENLAKNTTDSNKLLEEIGGIKQKLDNQNQQQIQVAKITQTIDNQLVMVKKWDRLNHEIGSSDGAKFRKFAQSLTLNRLVGCANRHLEKLHGRYIIRVSAKEDLEMEILDTFLGNSIRKMNSLSGGESFLVSLALALGLADLAGRKAQIRSLFIDEGFGSLDENALSTAISALENLQTEGIQIGIVSHVKELKERIFPQIVVKRTADGSSKIDIIEYFDA